MKLRVLAEPDTAVSALNEIDSGFAEPTIGVFDR
jgi:hypothetical protein